MSFIQDSIGVLRARGYKTTRPRQRVLQVLEGVEEPLSPYEIQRALQRQGQYLDPVTIYRVLDLLCALNLAHKMLSMGGFVRCSLQEEGCHRFLVCRQCGALQEFADRTLCAREDEVAQRLGFQAEHHLTESYGLCSHCRQ